MGSNSRIPSFLGDVCSTVRRGSLLFVRVLPPPLQDLSGEGLAAPWGGCELCRQVVPLQFCAPFPTKMVPVSGVECCVGEGYQEGRRASLLSQEGLGCGGSSR